MEKIPVDVRGAIRARRSVRTYRPEQLSEEDRAKLAVYRDQMSNPFGVEVRVHMVDKSTSAKGEKLGTYGTIKGAQTYLGISVDDVPLNMEAVGYQFESLVLCAQDMGLATVWLAATFSRKDFERAMGIGSNELFPVISPIGYPAGRASLSDSLTRKALGSAHRKGWESLFFDGDFDQPIAKDHAQGYAEPLEMVRLAPSATNAQPWRVVREGDTFHFFASYKAGLSDDERLIKRVDLGIAMAHFDQTLLELGVLGRFSRQKAVGFPVPEEAHYIATWTRR